MTFATKTPGHNPDWDIDLRFGEDTERSLVTLFNAFDGGHQRLEVKAEERQGLRTGNIYIEFAQTPSGQAEKKSGIATTKADWYAIHFGQLVVMAHVEYLKYAARTWAKDHPNSVVTGGAGGDNPTRGVLIPLAELARLVYACRPFA